LMARWSYSSIEEAQAGSTGGDEVGEDGRVGIEVDDMMRRDV
jgi:hypothetical protein